MALPAGDRARRARLRRFDRAEGSSEQNLWTPAGPMRRDPNSYQTLKLRQQLLAAEFLHETKSLVARRVRAQPHQTLFVPFASLLRRWRCGVSACGRRGWIAVPLSTCALGGVAVEWPPGAQSDRGPAVVTFRSLIHWRSASPGRARARREAGQGALRPVGRYCPEQALRAGSQSRHPFAWQARMSAHFPPRTWRREMRHARPQRSPELRLQRGTTQGSPIGSLLPHPWKLDGALPDCRMRESHWRAAIARPSPLRIARTTQVTLAAQKLRGSARCQRRPPACPLTRRAVSRLPLSQIAHRRRSGERPGTPAILRATRAAWRPFSPAPHRWRLAEWAQRE